MGGVQSCNTKNQEQNQMNGKKATMNDQRNGNKVTPVSNGHSPQDMNSSTKTVELISEKEHKNQKNKELRGDLTMYADARMARERRLQNSFRQREKMAQEHVQRLMDNTERFSLSTTRSRNTSRATSPGGANHSTGQVTVSLTSSPNTTFDVLSAVEDSPDPAPPSSRANPSSTNHNGIKQESRIGASNCSTDETLDNSENIRQKSLDDRLSEPATENGASDSPDSQKQNGIPHSPNRPSQNAVGNVASSKASKASSKKGKKEQRQVIKANLRKTNDQQS